MNNLYISGVIDTIPKELLEGRINVEANVIGSMVNDMLLVEDTNIDSSKFLTRDARLVYGILKTLREKKCTIFDEVSVLTYASDDVKGKLEEIGGFRAVKNMADCVNNQNYEAYLDDLLKSNMIIDMHKFGFNLLEPIKYEGKTSTNPLAFRFYNPDEVIAGKPMREHLKFAVAYWHTMCAGGTDMFGVDTHDKTFGSTDPMEHAKNKAHAIFELMNKLSIDYFCFHDRDIAPEGRTLAESNERLDVISDLLADLMKENGKKLLWGTANCFGNPRYMHGAGTSPNADVFAFAAAQIKKAI